MSRKLLRLLLSVVILSLLLAACGEDAFRAVEPTPSPPPPVEDLPIAAGPTTAPPAAVEPTPTPTNLPAPRIVLPAPLYFLSDGQIQRLETDGQILTQLTQEAEPITDFDVSPIDARLIYVTNNSLIEANPQYGTRIVKVTGDPFDESVPGDAITKQISDPLFSPDGSRIAFGLNGVNVIDAGDSITYTGLLQSDPYPDLNNPPRSDVRFFIPGSWSPDGQTLLVRFSYWPEAGGMALFSLADNSLIPLNSENPNTPLCCEWAWGRDGATAFIASNLLAYGVPGLARVDVASGAATLLAAGFGESGEVTTAEPLSLFRSPYETGETLMAFVSQQSQINDPARYRMIELGSGDDPLIFLRQDEFETYGDILWARDGSGAALANVEDVGPLGFAGPILWLPANGEPAIELPAYGEHLRWGPSATAPVTRTPAQADAETETPIEDGDVISATLTAQLLVNVRGGPSTAYAIVGDLEGGESTRITGVSPDGGWWQIVYPPDSEEFAWVIGDPQFTQAQNTEDVAVVTPPPLPRSVGRIFYSAPGPDGLGSILAQSLAPGAAPQLILADASQPALFRGERLAVRSSRSDLLGIGVFNIPGEQLTGVTSHLEDSNPNWSPDGGRMVFASTRHGDRRWRIYTVPADGSQTAQELTFGLDPDWHPSAERIIYKGCDDSGEACGLWLMDSSGSNRAPVTSDKTDSRPVWSADGRTVAFMSEARHGNWEIYVADVNSATVSRLTNDGALDGLPTVSPDGSRVAFVSNRGGSWGIWVVPITGGVPQQVINIGPDLPNWLEQGIDWAE